MRANCRTHALALIGALAVSCLAGPGCEAQKSLTFANSLPSGVGSTGSLHDAVVMLPPCRQPSPREEAANSPPARAGDAAPIVWRASPGTLNAEPAQENPAPVVPVSWDIGAIAHRKSAALPPPNDLPRELNMVTMPLYRVEPPDVLLINALRVLPRPTYKIAPLDQLVIQAAKLTEGGPIEPSPIYTVGLDRQVNFGPDHGRVTVAGLTLEQAGAAISEHLEKVHNTPGKPPAVSVALAPAQVISGPHMVGMDGTVNLGIYGDAFLAGLTLAEARHAVEARLAQAQLDAQVTVDVLGYNSKVYYVIYDGGGAGQQVITLPYQGNERVLDAISKAAQGLPIQSSTHRIWVARPVPAQLGCRQVLPVDWEAITEGAATNTNYQLFPGDRVYVKADCMVAFYNRVSRLVAPFERLFGFTLLGNATIRAVDGQTGGVAGGVP